ncbi:MAG: type II secretion system protein GspD [Verrucomicrobia bacterium]|nr:type II secretion system protein GspD [Verrucomicrobiota bacterium]
MKIKLSIVLTALVLAAAAAPAQNQAQPPRKAEVPKAPEQPPKPEELADIAYDDSDLITVVKSLALRAELNVLFDPKLVATAAPADQIKVPAFRMTQVTPLQALEAILNNHSLVMVADPKTKTVRITAKDAAQQEPLVTRIVLLKNASPTNMASVLPAFVSTRVKVSTDSRTSQLIIAATEKEWEIINDLVEKLDTPMKQVLIEARIMESSRSPRSVKGIDWSGTLSAQNVSFGNGRVTGTATTTIPGTPVTTTTTLPSGSVVTSTSTPKFTTANALTTAIGGVGAGGFNLNTASGLTPAIGFLNADGVNAVLSFLNTDSETDLIATPRTVMMDGQTAKLSVTRAFPIFKITPGTAQTPAGSEITYTNLGTILEVSPRVAPDGRVMLKLTPEVSNIDGKDTQTINGQQNVANIYAIRRIETQVIIPSGDTLVMGGLINTTSTKAYRKVPLLGDIPGLGVAFRYEDKSRQKQNLIIFVTPTLIEAGHFQPSQPDFLGSEFPDSGTEFLKTKAPVQAADKERPFDSARPVPLRDLNKK